MKMRRFVRFLAAVLGEMRSNSYDIVFTVYFRLSSVLRILSRQQTMILDIRTGYDGENPLVSTVSNFMLLCESLLFSHVTVISESLREELGIRRPKAHILPLAALPYETAAKSFDTLNLLYVGTFDYRHMDRTIAGFTRFSETLQNPVPLRYDLVGFGSPEEIKRVERAIEESSCRHLIHFHGRVPHNELHRFLEASNVGIAFVPMTRQYDCQPSTKIFEYFLSGMPVIATNTRENKVVMNETNGVLVDDTTEAFCDGLHTIVRNRARYDSSTIKRSSQQYTWSTIIHDNLDRYLKGLLRQEDVTWQGTPQHTAAL
jgi:glycosyltransferase involved in cell wall biosynthesis